MTVASEISPGGTLIAGWRRKLATRGALVAALVAVPVAVAAAIGIGGGAGSLLGVSSLVGGPTELAIGIPAGGAASAPGERLAELAGGEAAVSSAPPALSRVGGDRQAGGGSGGSTGAGGGGGGGGGGGSTPNQQAGQASPGLGQGLADTTRPLTGELGPVGSLLQGAVDAVGSTLDALLNPPPSR